MTRSTLTAMLLIAGCVGSTSSWAAGPQAGMLPGYFNPKSGTFTTQSTRPSEAEMQTLAAQVYHGVMSLKITITIKSPIPTSWPINCTQSDSVFDPSGLYYSSSKTVIATRSGSTATCTVNVNYAWNLTSGAVQVSADYVVGTYGDSTSLVQVQAIGSMPDVTIPADNGSSIRSVAVTL
jgi:hypothetical protein